MRRVILEIGGLVLFAAVALFLLVPMFRSGRRQAEQARWPRVRAEVLEQRVRLRGDTGFAELRVRFEVDGRAHESLAGSPDGLGYTHYGINYKVRKAVDAKMARRAVGSRIDVLVNPADPAEVFFVERELPARTLTYVATAIFLVFLAIFVVVAFDFL